MELNQFRDMDLVIDKANDNFIQRQFVSQGDYKGRTLTVQVTDNGLIGQVPGLMLNLRWQNQASGLADLSAFECIDEENSIFRIEYPEHMMTPGKVVANIQVIQNGQATHLKTFEMTVQALAGEMTGIVSQAEYGALVTVLADANKFRTDIVNLELDKADKIDLEETDKELQLLNAKKADKDFVDAQLASIVSGAPKGTYSTLAALQQAYPSGTEGIFLVLADGNWYYWNESSKKWLSGGVYQAEKSRLSVLPKDVRLWHTFKVSTEIGASYVFNNTANTLENTDNYFETSVPGYGAYTALLKLPEKAWETMLFLRGTSNYRISLIEYDSNAKVLASSDWANSIDWTLSTGCRYVVFGIKRYDNTAMLLGELPNVDCDVLSDTVSELTSTLPIADDFFGEWLQSTYYAPSNGGPIENLIYSNYRMSNLIKVNPSTYYSLTVELKAKYRYGVDLFDDKKNKIIACGWAESKSSLLIRTPPNCHYLVLTLANLGDSGMFKDAQRLDMVVKLLNDGNQINQYRGPEKNQEFEVKNTWQNLSIGKGGDDRITTPVVTNRLLTRLDIKGGKTYIVSTIAPSNYRFNYVQVAASGEYLYESYWQNGGARIKADVDGYLYIAVYKLDDTDVVVDIAVDDAVNFKIKVKESTSQNPLLENRFKKKVICHRGASLIEPENTLPAFERCGRLRVWGCEMDIRYTSDGYAIIMHDETVDRTTDGTGKVSEMTLAQIKELTIDFGQNIESYTGLKVPTLKEAVDACRIYGTMPVFDFGILVGNEDDELLERLLSDIAELGVLNDCLIICQTTWIASSVRAKNSTTPIVMAYSGLIGADLESRRLFRFENAYCGGWYLTTTTDEQLKDLYQTGKRDYNLQFYMLTNSQEEAKKYMELGCDFISSDDPYILNFE